MKYALPFVVAFGLFALALPAEAATVGFSQSQYSVREGEDAQILIKMVGEVTTSSTVRVLVTSGTARRGVDYESPIISYIQFLPGGLTEKTLVIKTKAGANPSVTPKTLTLRLLGVTGGGGVDPVRATARLSIGGSGAGAPPPGGSQPAGGGTWFTRGLTGFDTMTPACNPVPTVGATCSDTGAVCKANGLAYECRSKYARVSVVGRVLDATSGAGIAGARVVTHAVYGGGFEKYVTTDTEGNYKFDEVLGVHHVIRASKDGYVLIQGVGVPGPDRDISEPGATVGTLQADDILLAKVDQDYVGPIQNIQSESVGDPIRFKNGNRKILYGTSANFVWVGLGRDGELCTYTLIHPTNPSLNNTDPQMCTRRAHYTRMGDLGYTYNAATDEWRATVNHAAYPIDLRYALVGHNPTTRKAATLVIDITPFAADADNQSYTPIYPQWGWGTGAGWNFYLLPVETKRIGQPITISVTGGQAGSSVTISAEQSSRPGDSVDIASPTGTVNSQGHYSTTVTVRGLPRTVSFRADSPARSKSIGGHANFHYGTGQTTPPPPPGSGPALFLNVKLNGVAVTSPISVKVGDQLRYEWGDTNPNANTTYSSSFTTVAGDTSKCSTSGPWEVNQQNGVSGSKDRTVLGYQAGCSYVIRYRAVGSGQTAESEIRISVAGADTTTPPPGGTCPVSNPGSGTFQNASGQTIEWFCGTTRPSPNLAAPHNWTDQSPASCTATDVKCWHRVQPPPPSSPPPGGGDGGGSGGGSDSTDSSLTDFLRNLLNLIF